MSAPAAIQHAITCPGETCQGECNPPPTYTHVQLRRVCHYVVAVPEDLQHDREGAELWAEAHFACLPTPDHEVYAVTSPQDSEQWTALEGP